LSSQVSAHAYDAGAAGLSAASGVKDLRLHCDAAGSRSAECADGAQR
jgi:hypothetical protein